MIVLSLSLSFTNLPSLFLSCIFFCYSSNYNKHETAHSAQEFKLLSCSFSLGMRLELENDNTVSEIYLMSLVLVTDMMRNPWKLRSKPK